MKIKGTASGIKLPLINLIVLRETKIIFVCKGKE